MYKKIIIPILPFVLLSAVSAEEIASTRLNDTVISTKGFSSTLAEENKNVVIFNNEDIKNNGFSTLDNVLDSAPFINVKAGEKGSDRNIDLRGQGKNSPSSVKVMLDSTPLNILDTSHSQMPLNSVNVSTIDRIEIIPGGGSVLYGNNATGGTVNIITKADSQKEYGYAQYLYKSYRIEDLSMGIGRKVNDKLYLNFDYSSLNGDGYRFGDSSKTHFLSGGFAYNLTDKQTVSFNTKYSQSNGTTSNGITATQIEENRRQAGDFITDYKDTTQDYTLKYDYKVSDNYEINAKVYYQIFNTNLDSSGKIHIAPGSEYDILSGEMAFNKVYDGVWFGSFKETKTGANIKEKFSYSSGSIITGYDYLTNNLNRDNVVDMKVSQGMTYSLNANNTLTKDTHSIFALLDQKIISDLSFNAGVRYELAYYSAIRSADLQHSSSNPNIPPLTQHPSWSGKKRDNNQAYSAGLAYDFNSTNKVYISYERGYVSPSPTQIINKDIIAGYYFNDLKSQTGDNYEIGYKGYVLGSFFTLTSFYAQNNNEITMKGAGTPSGLDIHSQWSYMNLDRTRRTGAEAFAEQNIWRLTFNESATYLNTRVLRGEYAGQRVATVPDWKAIVNAKLEVIDKLNLGARFNYTGKYLENNVADSADQTFAPSTFTTDLTMDYSPVNKFYLVAGVNNVFNEKYNISQDSFDNYVVAPERNYYAGLRYEF
ncbi:MAG: TonB-dependent receptor [Alphaproteobacteria bacterium]|nr:TonB-dependent receptor [Alphaproteobacteria bacterium]